jgi:nucleoid-associated protein YgaU
MRTFAERPKAASQAAARLPAGNPRGVPADAVARRFQHDFSRVSVHPAPPRPADSPYWRAATAGAGRPVPYQAAMEHLFGHDFSGVRAHVGRAAALDGLDARAATDGDQVAFASPAPSARQVAHELAHVVQLRRSGGSAADGRVSEPGGRVSEPGGAAEREAGQAADRASRGEAVSVGVAAPPVLHRDLKSGNLEVPDGFFRIDMAKQEVAGHKSGEDGHIHYRPKPTAPDSKRIRLSQAVEVKDLAAGTEVSWAASVPGEANRDAMESKSRRRVHTTAAGDTLDSVSTEHFGSKDQAAQIGKDNDKVIRPAGPDALANTTKPLPAGLVLQILGAERAGYFIDHLAADPAAKKRGGGADPSVLQDYVWPPEHKPLNHDGHKDGTDVSEAVLEDFPGTGSHHWRFNFETVARSDDTGLYYGTLLWHFEVDATAAPPTVTKEWYNVQPGISDTFRSALTEFNRFYANPHTVVQGQTLEQISQLYFGKADHANAIFAANAALIGTRDTPLQAGWKLRIPGVSP